MNTNITKKLIIGALSVALTTVAMVPAFASADDGSHVGVKFHENSNFGFGLGSLNLGATVSGQDNNSIKDIIKPAKTALKQSVKDANVAYKTAKKNAQVQLKASITPTTSKPDRIIAVKTYFASVLAAFKVKSTAIEAALQTFINTNFTI